MWCQDMSRAPSRKQSCRGGVFGGPGSDRGLAPNGPRVAEGLGVVWHTANDAVLAEGKRILIDDPKGSTA